jgi:tetratricopeptide (TPR) repeat protein
MVSSLSYRIPIALILLVGTYGVAQSNANDIATYARDGQVALASGKYIEAESDYSKLTAMEPSVAEFHATLGVIYYQQGSFEHAATELHRALSLKPAISKVPGLLAMSLAELGHYQEVLPGLEKAFHQSTDLSIKRMAGLQLERAYTALQQDRNAVQTALEMEKSFGDDPEVLYNNERIYGNYAFLTIQKLKTAAPNSVWKHLAAAEAQESQDNYAAAIAEYRVVLSMDPGRPGIHYKLGRTLLDKWHASQQPDDLAAAKQEFGLELDLDPANSNAAYEIGEIDRQAGQLDDAQAFFEKAVIYHSDFTEAQIGLAVALSSRGKWQEALPHLERAVALRPDDDVAWCRLSQIYRALGDAVNQKKALAVFQQLRSKSSPEQDKVPREVTQPKLDSDPTP